MKGKRIWPMVLVALALCAMLTGCGCTAKNAQTKPNNGTTSTTNNGTTSTTNNGATSSTHENGTVSTEPGVAENAAGSSAVQEDEYAVDTDTSAARNRRTVAENTTHNGVVRNGTTVGNAAGNVVGDTVNTAENVVNDAANAVKDVANGAGRVVEDVTGGVTRTTGTTVR